LQVGKWERANLKKNKAYPKKQKEEEKIKGIRGKPVRHVPNGDAKGKNVPPQWSQRTHGVSSTGELPARKEGSSKGVRRHSKPRSKPERGEHGCGRGKKVWFQKGGVEPEKKDLKTRGLGCIFKKKSERKGRGEHQQNGLAVSRVTRRKRRGENKRPEP